MSQVNCLYCGKSVPDDSENCPHCGKRSHFKKKGSLSMTTRQFYYFFVAIALICAFLIFWFPR